MTFSEHLYIQTLSKCNASFVCEPWCLSRKKQYRTCKVVAQFVVGGPDSLGGQSRERGGNLPYCDVTKRTFSKLSISAFIFSKAECRGRLPRAWFTPIDISSPWGTKCTCQRHFPLLILVWYVCWGQEMGTRLLNLEFSLLTIWNIRQAL